MPDPSFKVHSNASSTSPSNNNSNNILLLEEHSTSAPETLQANTQATGDHSKSSYSPESSLYEKPPSSPVTMHTDSRSDDLAAPSASLFSNYHPSSASASASNIVTLRVGEQYFTTTRETLTRESPFFARLLQGQHSEGGSLPAEDGSYFVDADPGLFAHVLRYLRRGTFPLFWDPSRRQHDLGLYAALLGEARFFDIAPLVSWLQSKKYLNAVRVRYTADICEDIDALTDTVEGGAEREHRVLRRVKRVYVCPRGIPVHDAPDRCGRACEKVRGDGPVEWEEVKCLEVLVIQKTTVLEPEICYRG